MQFSAQRVKEKIGAKIRHDCTIRHIQSDAAPRQLPIMEFGKHILVINLRAFSPIQTKRKKRMMMMMNVSQIGCDVRSPKAIRKPNKKRSLNFDSSEKRLTIHSSKIDRRQKLMLTISVARLAAPHLQTYYVIHDKTR